MSRKILLYLKPHGDVTGTAYLACGPGDSVRIGQLKLWDAFEPGFQSHFHFHSRQVGAGATMDADAEGDGWIFKMTISDASQLDDLMDADAYKTHLAELE